MRRFLSADIPCKAGCRYCFAKWNDIYHGQSLSGMDKENVDSEQIILYPCCDGDFFDQHELTDTVRRFSKSHKKVYVSLSGKVKPDDRQIKQLLLLNKRLKEENRGFVKFAVSLSCRSMIDEIEPGTMSYEERTELAGYIHDSGLPLSLTIKPVLPFVSAEEYVSILEDFRPYLQYVLTGGLYIDRTSDFYIHYLQKNYACTKRKVTWLPDHPDWDYVEDRELMEKINFSARKLGMRVFDSDIEVIKALTDEG